MRLLDLVVFNFVLNTVLGARHASNHRFKDAAAVERLSREPIITYAATSKQFRIPSVQLSQNSFKFSNSSEATTQPAPPVAEKRPHTVLFGKVDRTYVEANGGNLALMERGSDPMDPPRSIEDDYFWLRDDQRQDVEVLKHLQAENKYAESTTAHLEDLRNQLYGELKSHMKEDDVSAPYPLGNWEYFTRWEKGKPYPIHCRRPRGFGKRFEYGDVLLDENDIALGHAYTSVGAVEVSPEETPKLLAYSVDHSGNEEYIIQFEDISTGQMLADVLNGTDGTIVWGANSTTCFYLKMDSAHRTFQVWKHDMGHPQSQDILIFSEEDPLFSVWASKTRDKKLLLVGVSSGETTEVHYLDMQKPESNLTVVQPRTFGLVYSVSHRAGQLYIVTNEAEAHNYKLVTAPLSSPGIANWVPVLDSEGQTILGHALTRTVDTVTCFADFIVCSGREEGLSQIWVLTMHPLIPHSDQPSAQLDNWHRIEWPESVCSNWLSTNAEFKTTLLRVGFSSMVTPLQSLDYDVRKRKFRLVKAKEVPGYDPSLYASSRHQVEAHDGAWIPVTLLWRKDAVPTDFGTTAQVSPAPLHLYGYGSYGSSLNPYFDDERLPLLDRGVVYALAHVRGGAEKGYWQWYEKGGKYLTKQNTFTDFIAVARWLVQVEWTSSQMLSMEGRSAGGLLIGNVLNMAPKLFRAAIAGVPFVDLMVTMCDATIPLTTGEWQEWGNPNEEQYFDYMLSYSPIDQVRPQAYPSLLITAGLHDPRVGYWEAAKWAQVLRDRKTNEPSDGKHIILKVDMASGHFSASDRYKFLEKVAYDQAWLLEQLGRSRIKPPKPVGSGAFHDYLAASVMLWFFPLAVQFFLDPCS